MVKLNASIDRIVVFERGQRGAFLRVRRELQMEKYDLALDLQRHFKSGLFTWLSGARRRIGFHRQNGKEMNWIFNNEQIERCPIEFSKIRHYWKFLDHLKVPVPSRPDFGLAQIDPRSVCSEFYDRLTRPFIAVVMGSTWQSKDWLASGYLNLARALIGEGRYNIVLVGDRSQVELARRIEEEVGSPRILNLAGRTSLLQLVAVLKLSSAAVGPDSGPGHIASAVGRPYVTLFGPTSPARVAPFGSEDHVVQSRIGCAPCYRRECPGLNKPCMRLIGAEAVLEKLHGALNIL
jgi:lipopolysaccharide heptosyltransferase II